MPEGQARLRIQAPGLVQLVFFFLVGRVHLLRARRRIRSRILAVRPSIVEDLS